MIKIRTMDRREMALNTDLIERVESIPETIITLTNGKKIIVLETMDEVLEKIREYQSYVSKCKFMRSGTES